MQVRLEGGAAKGAENAAETRGSCNEMLRKGAEKDVHIRSPYGKACGVALSAIRCPMAVMNLRNGPSRRRP